MTTAIIGVGNIGSVLAANLVRGGEDVVLAGRNLKRAQAVADSVGARATTVDEAIDTANVVIFAVMFDDTKELLTTYGSALRGKIVVDPSNPVAVDGKGGFTKTIPENESSGQVLAALAPSDAGFVKAFGTQSAQTLAGSSNQQPRTAQFYATDDEAAGAVVAELIRTGGHTPVLVGGLDQAIRIEVFGDLHETTLGAALSEDDAKKLI